MQPSDQRVRERFVTEVERNFSVIAPAGVGKTRAIVDRIIHIATMDGNRAREWLPKLVVVTYTRKAADEMHQRARNAIIEHGTDLTILGAFNRAFFGTIHSFCQHLLTAHGCHLGLPSRVELAEDEDALWAAFVRQVNEVAADVPATIRTACLRHVPMDDVVRLARQLSPQAAVTSDPGPCPLIRIDRLMACTSKRADSQENIRRGQALASQFVEACKRGDPYVPLPDWEKGGKDFVAAWNAAFEPLRAWLRSASRLVAADLARAYRAYRLAQGKLTYDDQVSLALELTRHPEAGRAIREEGYRVILDEAQDTDPVQFEVLLALSGQAEPGRFSMVGDPQQSIYGKRADLAVYRGIHQDLIDKHRAEELVFEVTFRCDQAIVDEVNRFGPAMLDGTDGQASFVPLRTRPGAGPGQVVRWTPSVIPPEDATIGDRARAEARELAVWIAAQGLDRLRAETWSDVALLCPRTKWLATLRLALEEAGLRTQVQSERDIEGDHPACAWFTALMRIIAEPRNGFEIVGVLREVFGVSDEHLADVARGDGSRFRIDVAADGDGPASRVLNQLCAARAAALRLPLRDAAELMVRETQLRERLAAIAEDGGFGSDEVLDGLLVRTAEAEAEGQTLESWSAALRVSFLRNVASHALDRDAIQLITCQKAKGLEWMAVIVPMMFRPIGERNPEYPAVIGSPGGATPTVALDGTDYAALKPAVELKRRQEYQRLLYVTLTRAKETLVVADDAALFDKHAKSFAELLGILDGPRAQAFRTWPSAPVPRVGTSPRKSSKDWKLQPCPAVDPAAARAHSEDFARRVLPSSLAVHGAPRADAEPEQRLDADPEWATAAGEIARAYGTWWHETVELIDWSSARELWQARFEARMPTCPQPERARREWALFLGSDMPARLSAPGLVIHAEMPFLFRRPGGDGVEGIIDLAVYDPAGSRWHVFDWKTNLVSAEQASSLKDIYAPQLRAYAEALTAVTGHPADASLYATSVGLLLPC